MENVGLVVGILAMLVALGAVFYASTAMRKIEEFGASFLRSHIDPMGAELRELKANANATKRSVEKLENDIGPVKDLRKEVERSLQDFAKHIEAMKPPPPPPPKKPHHEQ